MGLFYNKLSQISHMIIFPKNRNLTNNEIESWVEGVEKLIFSAIKKNTPINKDFDSINQYINLKIIIITEN